MALYRSPLTNVVAFIVFEEGFHQPIKRTKQRYQFPQIILTLSFLPKREAPELCRYEIKLRNLILPRTPKPNGYSKGFSYMPHNHTTTLLSIFCIRKIYQLGPVLNPQPWVQGQRQTNYSTQSVNMLSLITGKGFLSVEEVRLSNETAYHTIDSGC
ncbi:hypothetical protein TNCV_4168621 [Trichonephila clavipes]|nr:hypothetical protein TNCV_4168621 [Trichonephila clavipes]